jgi:hypothetical protein
MTTARREQLFQCLLRFINPAFEQAKERQVKSAVTLGRTKALSDVPDPAFTPRRVS